MTSAEAITKGFTEWVLRSVDGTSIELRAVPGSGRIFLRVGGRLVAVEAQHVRGLADALVEAEDIASTRGAA